MKISALTPNPTYSTDLSIDITAKELSTGEGILMAICEKHVYVLKVRQLIFDLTTEECINDNMKFKLTTPNLYYTLNPVVGDVVILNQNTDECKFSLIDVPDNNNTITFDLPMSNCSIHYDLTSHMILSHSNIILHDNINLYEFRCHKNYLDLDVESGAVTNIDVPIAYEHQLYNEALVFHINFYDTTDGSVLTSAHIGDEVELRVSVNETFVNDFYFKINTCYLDKIKVYDNCRLLQYFGNFQQDPV